MVELPYQPQQLAGSAVGLPRLEMAKKDQSWPSCFELNLREMSREMRPYGKPNGISLTAAAAVVVVVVVVIASVVVVVGIVGTKGFWSDSAAAAASVGAGLVRG